MQNHHKLTSLAISLGISFSLLSCAPVSVTTETNESKLQGKLTLTGSSSVAPLANEIAKRFEAENPEVRIDVQTGGSSRGLADAKQGLADIGMVSRALKEEENQQLKGFAIARDGIGIIVHADNPISSLTDEQVLQIYTGEINNWQEVGGVDAAITVVNKAEGRSTLELFLKYFQLNNSQVKADVIIGDNQQGLKTIAGNGNSIGYVSIGAAEYDITEGIPIKILPVGGVEATTQTVQNGSFPLSRPLTLVTKKEPKGLSKEFIDFARSPAVHDLVEEQNLVPLEVEN